MMSTKEDIYTYKAGACIIGSLLWDKKDGREEWQRKSFGEKFYSKLIPVLLPIRYGRFSTKWKAPTMVFSSEYLVQEKLGQGYVIPFKQNALSIENIIEEARAMSHAEGNNDSKFIKGDTQWCILLCWINPDIKDEKREYFLKSWKPEYGKEITNEVQAHFKMENEEQAVFDKNGELQINWPDELKDFDVLFATQTKPRQKDNERSTYYTSKELCQLISQEKEYFIKNVQNGILTRDDSLILKCLMNNEAIIYYRNEFRNARYQALLNSEDFTSLLFVLESFGGYLARLCESNDWGLGKLKKYLKAFISDSPYLYDIPQKYPVHHCEFDFLYKFVQDTRNEYAHKGVYARQKTRFILELCLIFESKLNELDMKASNYAVSGVTIAEIWQPISLVKKEMLINSYSYLPIYVDGEWMLISDYNLAVYLRKSKKRKESETLEQALNNEIDKLKLESVEQLKPDKDISDIKLNDTKPKLVVDEVNSEKLYGLFTAFDLL